MPKMPPASRSQVNRRDFLRTAAAAAVAPMIVPRHVIARSQATPPSDRITLGHIGIGRMGGGHVRGFLKMPDARVVAMCDIREETLEKYKASVDSHYGDKACLGFTDFRELLARKDIDAVVIAPGERWHPLVGIEAARRGKHMYCEKPLSVTLAEGLALREAVKKSDDGHVVRRRVQQGHRVRRGQLRDPVARLDRGSQGSDVELPGRVRPCGRRQHHRRDQERQLQVQRIGGVLQTARKPDRKLLGPAAHVRRDRRHVAVVREAALQVRQLGVHAGWPCADPGHVVQRETRPALLSQ